jgi:hypothetical protein
MAGEMVIGWGEACSWSGAGGKSGVEPPLQALVAEN